MINKNISRFIFFDNFNGKLSAIFIPELQKFGKITTTFNQEIFIDFKFICNYNSLNNFNLLIINLKYYISIIAIFEYVNYYYLIKILKKINFSV